MQKDGEKWKRVGIYQCKHDLREDSNNRQYDHNSKLK